MFSSGQKVFVVLFIVCCSFFGLIQGDKCPNYPTPVKIPNINSNAKIQGLLKQIDAFINDYVTSDQVPGFACAIVYDQELIFGKGYGKQNYFDSNSPKPNLETVTRIASLSKTFTDALLFYLRDNGTVNLEDDVSKYISFSMKNPYSTKRPVTLRQLASHTSGLPREIPCPWEKLSVCTEEQILSKLAEQYLILPQYYRPHYSNLGIALLGRALEKSVGVPFEDLIKRVILHPMGMTSSSFTPDQNIKPHLGVGVIFLDNGTAIPAPIENLGWGNPMGGMFASIRDMATYMSFLFRTDKTAGGSQVLDGATILEFLKPVILTREGTAGFGTPWEFNYTGSHWVTSKAGELDGYRSQMAMVPELKLGVFTTALETDVSDPTVLTIPIINKLLPIFNEVLESLQPQPPVPSNYNLFLGNYLNTNDNTDPFTISLQGKTLTINSGVGVGNLTASGVDPLVLRLMIADPAPYSCRGLDDGPEYEFVYFTLNSKKDHAETVQLMGETYQFIHN